MSGVAIATGNAFILKPSERDPSRCRCGSASLFLEAGLPAGILQVVHGDKEMVDAILDHSGDLARSASWDRSDIAHYVYRRGVAAGKRVQAMGGAKNHGIVMPDADLDQVVADLSGAAFGSVRASGAWRCPSSCRSARRPPIALREKLIPAIAALRVGVSTDNDAHYGPVVNAAHKQADRGLDSDRRRRGRRTGRRRSRVQRCRDTRKAFSSAPVAVRPRHPRDERVQGGDFRPRPPDRPRARFRDRGEAAERPPIRQRRRDLHAQRPCRARIRRAGERRHGRHQRADPGAGRLPYLRRVEAQRVRRYQPARHGGGEVLDQGQDHHPALA